jgi:hypothetical protein
MKNLTRVMLAVALMMMPAATPVVMAAASCHRTVGATGTTAATDRHAGHDCSVMRSEQEWKEWRERNPNVPSKIMALQEIEQIPASLSVAASADDPEPGISLGPCGCDPATALGTGGCGWVHENIIQWWIRLMQVVPQFI